MDEDQKGKIILDIEDSEFTLLDGKNNITEIKGEGVLCIKNPSNENGLWNLNLSIENKDFTSIPATDSKERLDAGKSWDIGYELQNLKEPILKLVEVVDTSEKEEGVNENFVKDFNDFSTITLSLTNVYEKPIQDVVLNKEIPNFYTQLKVVRNDGGEVDLNTETRHLVWKCANIQPNETKEIVIDGVPEIKDSQIKTCNPVEVTYKSEMGQRSKILPKIEALTDSMTGMDREEDDSKPGWWNCEVEFENESDFEVTVKSLKVIKPDQVGTDVLVDEKPTVIVGPEKSWTYDLSVESAGVPTLNTELDFTVNYTVPTRILGIVKKEASTFKVLETSIRKEINPPAVNANANTDIIITNTILDEGTAPVDRIVYNDIVPKDFENPTMDEIECKIVNSSGDLVLNIQKENSKISVEPDDKDTTKPHTINIEFFDLVEHLISGNKLIVQYKIIARNPQPNVEYKTPVEIKSYTKVKGPAFEDTTPEMPIIGIKYVKRNVKAAKSISPGGEGNFKIRVKISNKGGVELENIEILEDIPKGFKAGSIKPEEISPEYIEVGDASQIKWNIARLDPGEVLKLEYISEGSGEYPRTEPKVTIAEPDSIKTQSSSKSEEVSDVSQAFREKLGGIINDIFIELERKVNKVMKFSDVADAVEQMRDDLIAKGKSSPVLHDVMLKAKEMKKEGEKMMVGAALDSFLAELADWKKRLIV